MKRLTLLVLAVGFLSGCEPQSAQEIAYYDHDSKPHSKVVETAETIWVSHDTRNNVTCWSKGNYTFSCLPDWMILPRSAPAGLSVQETFKQRREALACAEGRLTGPACEAWSKRSKEGL